MKKLFIISFLLIICVIKAFPQTYTAGDVENLYSDHGPFVKRIEFNLLIPGGGFNSDSKSRLEKKLFGESNAFVEFFYLPSRSGASGFSIVRSDSGTSYVLEARYISNYEELRKETSEKYPTIGISGPDDVSKDSLQKIKAHNGAQIRKQSEEMFERYNIESFTFQVSPRFAEELHEKMVSFIHDFKGKGIPPVIKGGHSVVFRNVVVDEVWSLSIQSPMGHPLKELCMQVLTDAKANQLDESKYMTILNTFEE